MIKKIFAHLKKNISFERNIKIILIGLILLTALYVRRHTFWLPHWQGDQSHYIALAMKLKTLGLKGYNLRRVDLHSTLLTLNEKNKPIFQNNVDFLQSNIIFPTLDNNPVSKGDLLYALEIIGLNYYDQPIFHKPPGLPIALIASHKLFGNKEQPFTVFNYEPEKNAESISALPFFSKDQLPKEVRALYDNRYIQFWAAIVPIFFSISTIFLTFLLGHFFFSYRAGLYAAFMIAVNPVSIMTSQKIWADDMLTCFMTVSILFFLIAIEKKLYWYSFLSGTGCGLAFLAKQSGGAVFISLLLFAGITLIIQLINKTERFKTKPLALLINLSLFSAGFLLISGFWLVKTYQVYGNIFWQPSRKGVIVKDPTGWLRAIYARPKPWRFFLTGIPYLCPLFFPAFLSLKDFVKSLYKKTNRDYCFLFIWVNIIIFYYFLGIKMGWQEHRRLLPIYPLLAVLSGHYLNKLVIYTGKLDKLFGTPKIKETLLVILFFIYAFWAVPKGIEPGVNNQTLIKTSTYGHTLPTKK
ncbi:MAG: glycosyltransferase family 39 protein [Candidatus Omnitrophica bacterium]|nr:glycosyltransferase family 39 protein [Candidatus Omnitrophota bacterium]